MYAQVEKPKENKSRAVANSVAQKKSSMKQGFGFVDNRAENIELRKLQKTLNYHSQYNPPIQQTPIPRTIIQRKIIIGQSEFETLGNLKEAWKNKFGPYDWSDTWDIHVTKWIEKNHEFVNYEDLRNQLLPKEDKFTQGAGLYVAGEVPNRILHQSHKDTPQKIHGDHFELKKDAQDDTLIPAHQGGVSSSDIEYQKPNFRGKQFRASNPVPEGWELRNDGAEVEGGQSKGHYSFRPTVEGKTLKDASEENHRLFQEQIGEVKEKKQERKKVKELTLDDTKSNPKPMGATLTTGEFDTSNAQSETKEPEKNRSESFTQTHYSSIEQREEMDLLAEGVRGKLLEGNDKWGLKHILKRHGSQFSQFGINEDKLVQLIKATLSDTHVNDIRKSEHELGGVTLDNYLTLRIPSGKEAEEWNYRVVVSDDGRVITAMPIPSESIVDRWDRGVKFYVP